MLKFVVYDIGSWTTYVAPNWRLTIGKAYILLFHDFFASVFGQISCSTSETNSEGSNLIDPPDNIACFAKKRISEHFISGGCGSVGIAVASDTKYLQFESSHHQILFTIKCIKRQNLIRRKETGNGPIKNIISSLTTKVVQVQMKHTQM